jgi:hypothetical protein
LRAAAVVACLLAVAACASTPPASAPVQPVADCVDEAQQRANGVTLTRMDGDTVDALMYGTGDVGLVFANQVEGDLCQWQWHAQTLAQQQGYRTVVFNYSMMVGAENDVLAAVDLLRKRGVAKVFLIGASKGGTAVLAAAGKASPAVSGVVSLSGPQAFSGSSAAEVMPTFTTPVVFIVGRDDGGFAKDAQTLYDACAERDKKLVIRPSGNHGIALVDADMFTLIKDFIANH